MKTLTWLILINLVFALVDPIPFIGKLSLYNLIFPGRIRLPYGDNPSRSFNLTVNQLDAMFASHELDSGKGEGEFRVFLIGDSSVWGFLQRHEDTLAAHLNLEGLRTQDGREVRFFNLGFPTLSLTKDLLILEHAQRFQPDLVLWFITLEALPIQKQLESPLLTYNPGATQALLQDHDLSWLDSQGVLGVRNFWERTIPGRRRLIADMIRHQIYGLLWTATQIDQEIPDDYDLRTEDLSKELTFQGMAPDQFSRALMAFDVIQAGYEMSDAPVIIVNEPIFISEGLNSEIRYNFYYPRWAYDAYLSMLETEAVQGGWELINLWNILPGDVFTDSAIHYDIAGVDMVIAELLSSPQLSFMVE